MEFSWVKILLEDCVPGRVDSELDYFVTRYAFLASCHRIIAQGGLRAALAKFQWAAALLMRR
jgi:hypothetical protein